MNAVCSYNLSIINLFFSVHFVYFLCIISTCNANAFDVCALNDYLLICSPEVLFQDLRRDEIRG